MSKMTSKRAGANKSISGFGRQGWLIIAYCMLMFWFYVGMVNDGTNITGPAAAERIGLGLPEILSAGSIAGVSAVIIFLLMGRVNTKIGPRHTSGWSLIVSGLSYLALGFSTSLTMYTICLALTAGFSMTAGYIAGGTLVAHWFPKKRGIVMGITTMGHNLASAFYVPLISVLVAGLGLSAGMLSIGLCVALLGMLGLVFIRDEPFDRGVYPDNVTPETYSREYDTSADEGQSAQWATSDLLKLREFWLAAIITGGLQLVTVGIMTQLVVRNVQLGFTQVQAISVMTVLALIGVFGSWLVGVIDQKIGTKPAVIYFTVWYILALAMNILETPWSVWVSIFMIGMSIGGSANFMISLPASIFGRHGFAKVNSVIFPLQGFISALGLFLSGASIAMFGSLRMAYVAYAVILMLLLLAMPAVRDRRYNRDFHVETLPVGAETNTAVGPEALGSGVDFDGQGAADR